VLDYDPTTLETQFYSNALAKFKASDFTDAGFSDPELAIQQFKVIHNDEAVHARALEVGQKVFVFSRIY
jgi:hypothetical protein